MLQAGTAKKLHFVVVQHRVLSEQGGAVKTAGLEGKPPGLGWRSPCDWGGVGRPSGVCSCD